MIDAQLRRFLIELRDDGTSFDLIAQATGGKVSRQAIGLFVRGGTMSLRHAALVADSLGLALGTPARTAATPQDAAGDDDDDDEEYDDDDDEPPGAGPRWHIPAEVAEAVRLLVADRRSRRRRRQ